MFQLEYLNRQKMKSLQVLTDKLGGFFSHAPDGFECAVEIRNPNYLKSAWLEFFASAGQTQQKPDGVLCQAASGIFVTGKGKTTF